MGKMRTYNFLGTKSFRTPDFKAKTIKDAWKLAKAWYLLFDRKNEFGALTSTYQTANENDFVMSGWKHSKSLGNKEFNEDVGFLVKE